jgi:hypothetical protein
MIIRNGPEKIQPKIQGHILEDLNFCVTVMAQLELISI